MILLSSLLSSQPALLATTTAAKGKNISFQHRDVDVVVLNDHLDRSESLFCASCLRKTNLLFNSLNGTDGLRPDSLSQEDL